jgi:nucleoside-diphosphate-sugar epimerase
MKVLILGGTGFIGKHLVKILTELKYDITLASRTASLHFPNISTITLDRNNPTDSNSEFFDIAVDLSCYSLVHLKNIISSFNYNKFIFVSSMAVTHASSLKDKELLYATEKNNCEAFIIKHIKNYTIIRPGYVLGEDDTRNRFYIKDSKYFWKKNNLEVTESILVEDLAWHIKDSFINNNRCIKLCVT